MINFEFQSNRKLRDEITSSRLNAILTELRRIRPVAGRGINIQQEGNGTRISALDSFVSGAAGGSRRQPWDIYVSDTEGEEDDIIYTLKVRPGTLARILPSNWDDDFEAGGDSLYYGIARVATDGEFITGVTIDITTDEPEANNAVKFGVPETVDILFGLFISGQSKNLVGFGDIDARPRELLTLPIESPNPGEPFFDIYYRLQ
jgi:hypothetical protein